MAPAKLSNPPSNPPGQSYFEAVPGPIEASRRPSSLAPMPSWAGLLLWPLVASEEWSSELR
jgi:hypothetical protein